MVLRVNAYFNNNPYKSTINIYLFRGWIFNKKFFVYFEYKFSKKAMVYVLKKYCSL